MSDSDHASPQPMDANELVLPSLSIHPKLMTNRGGSSNPNSAHHTPRSARGEVTVAAPSNAELAEAGVSAEDGVVRQLSARKHEAGALAGPRDVSGNSTARKPGPAAEGAGNGMGEPLQLSEARQRPNSAGTPRQQKQPAQPQQQPSRHAPYAVNSRASLASSREPIRPGRSGRAGGHSPFRSPSKTNDPYGHVTSVVHDYLNNNISALEAQYKSVRSHSSAPAGQASDAAEGRSTSRQDAHPQPQDPQQAHTHPQQQQQQEEESGMVHEVRTPRSARQDSPQPRNAAADYLRGGVPRAALDAPHIKYAAALDNMHNPRYSPSASSMPASTFVPQAAQYIPNRYKYVEPSDEEKKRRKAETLRLLQEWREAQKARAGAVRERKPSTWEAAEPAADTRRRTPVKNRAHTRAMQPPLPEEQQQQDQAEAEKPVAAPPKPTAKSQRKASPKPAQAPLAAADGEERPEWDFTFQPGFGAPPPTPRTGSQSPRTGSRTPRALRSGRKSGAASRASSRKGRKSRGATPPATARGEAEANPNAFRRKLLFDITAPTLSTA